MRHFFKDYKADFDDRSGGYAEFGVLKSGKATGNGRKQKYRICCLWAASMVAAFSLCSCSGTSGGLSGSEHVDGGITSEMTELRDPVPARKVEVFTGTLPDSANVSAGDPDGSGEDSAKGGKSTVSELPAGSDSSKTKVETVPILQEDMIPFETRYGNVFLVHEDGAILNIGTEVGEDRYHDGDMGFYYHSLSGMDALVPGYYNYYQSDDLGFDHFYVYSDSAYPQISFMTYTEGDGEELTEDNYEKYQNEILDAWEKETEGVYQEQSRTSFTLGGYKLREAVIRGKRNGKPVTACLELMWDSERHAILGISFFMCDTDGQAYMDDFVTMMTDHVYHDQ